jgi:kynurenine 3-monooxygenase
MVTFNENIRYSDAHRIGQKQTAIMQEVLQKPGIEDNWEKLDFAGIVARLH